VTGAKSESLYSVREGSAFDLKTVLISSCQQLR